jgi:hypothetical protein
MQAYFVLPVELIFEYLIKEYYICTIIESLKIEKYAGNQSLLWNSNLYVY